MKLLMIVVDSECKEELEVLLNRRKVGYTEIADAHGVGTTGIRMGSRAFPKTSSLIFTVLPDDQVSDLRDEILGFCEACERHMKMFMWTADEVV